VQEAVAHLGVEVDRSRTPIAGAVRAPDGETREFVGWMQLISVLTALIDSPAHPVSTGEVADAR
jgi:hypothetical protein